MKVTIEHPDFDPHPEKTTTENWKWRQCVFVDFGGYKWMPTYKELAEIYKKLCECEQINKKLAKKYFERRSKDGN